MAPLRTLHERLTAESLRLALLIGLVTVPFTVALSWNPAPGDTVVLGGSIDGGPVLLAGLLVGYLYGDRPTASHRAGLWTGLAASVAVLVVYLANSVATVQSASRELTAVAVVLTPIAVAFGVGLTVLVTVAAAALSGWVRTRLARARRVRERGPAPDESTPGETASSTGGSPRWRLPVAIYAVVAPIVLGTVFWVRPEGGIWFLAVFPGLFVLIPLAIVTLVGLFIETTTPRPWTDWVPNVWVYVGGPLLVYALVYVDALRRESINPSGDGTYGFVAALWVAAVGYLLLRHRSVRRA